MKQEFINKMYKGEEILYYGKTNVTKTSKQLGRHLIFALFTICFWMIYLVIINKNNYFGSSELIFLIILIIITLFIIYSFIYNTFLKYKNNNNEYFITTSRVAIYNPKQGFRIESIDNILQIVIAREKNNFGDMIINFNGKNLLDTIKSAMNIEGIENPRQVVESITKINNNILVSDDRPILLGKKL